MFRIFQIVFLAGCCLAYGKQLNPKRPFLNELESNSRSVAMDDYVHPYLIVQSATTSKFSVKKVSNRLRNYLKEYQLPYRAHYARNGLRAGQINKSNFKFPKEIWAGTNLSGMKKCNTEYCKMKLNTRLEKTLMERAEDKIDTFHGLVIGRIQRFLTNKQLRGYEDRKSNIPTIRKMVRVLNFLGKSYPACSRFIATDFWIGKRTSCEIANSFITMRVVDLKAPRIHPILRIGEVLSLRESNRHLFVHLFAYTNHYFDVAVRFFEIFKSKKGKTTIVITDFMEIDQLTKSSVIRFLYKGKMVRGIRKFQYSELVSLRD